MTILRKPSRKSSVGAVFLLFFALNVKAQIAIGIKWMGFTAHLKEYPYSKNYVGRLDKRGHFVVNDGVALTFDYYLNEHFFLKFVQAIIPHDCGRKLLGMTHLGFGYTHTNLYPHQGSISFGPMFFYRKSWHDLEFYSDPDGFFRVSRDGRWQTKFTWHGGQVEYDYFLSPQHAFSVNCVPAVPELFAFTPGWKYLSLKR